MYLRKNMRKYNNHHGAPDATCKSCGGERRKCEPPIAAMLQSIRRAASDEVMSLRRSTPS